MGGKVTIGDQPLEKHCHYTRDERRPWDANRGAFLSQRGQAETVRVTKYPAFQALIDLQRRDGWPFR